MKNIERKLHKIDAAGRPIGRVATQAALILRGKNKPEYQPNIDLGDIVEVFNLDQAKFTGRKFEQKVYHSYSGYQGGLKTKKMSDIYEKNPAEVLTRAVLQMLPPTRLRNNMMKRLFVK
jgi:large subunit ribosomal protein L13